MNIATKYIDKEEYDREWEPKYQALENKYYGEGNSADNDSTEYDSELERLDYFYAKSISQRIHQKIDESIADCKASLESSDYGGFEKCLEALNGFWKDFNTPFHYKMSGRTILEKD